IEDNIYNVNDKWQFSSDCGRCQFYSECLKRHTSKPFYIFNFYEMDLRLAFLCFIFCFRDVSTAVGDDIDECSSAPCQNEATCVDNVNKYTCTCKAGYHGVNCEIALTNSSSSEALKNLTQIVDAGNYNMVLKQTENWTRSDVTPTDADIIFAIEILQTIASLSVPWTTEAITDAFSIVENVLDSGKEAISAAQSAERTSNRVIQVIDTLLDQLNVSGNNDVVKITTKTMAAAVVEQAGSINSVVGIRMTSASEVSPDALVTVRAFAAEDNSDVDVGIKLDAALVVNYTTKLSFVVHTNPVLFVEENSTYQVNSMVVSATLKRDGENVEKLNNNKVWVTLKITEQNTLPLCGYWDIAENQGYGGWRTDGCSVEQDSQSHVTCSCNHLTNFAILMDPRNTIPPLYQFSLGVISKVGLGLSIAALSITITFFIAFKTLREKDHQKVLLNLSVSLFCYSVIFLAGIDKTGSRSGCVTVAVYHHFLSSLYLLMIGAFTTTTTDSLTWIFGFLTIDDSQLVFRYLFAICNSLLGILILALFVVRRGETLKLWHDLCCKKKVLTKISASDTWAPKQHMHSKRTPVSFVPRQLTQVEKPSKRARFYEDG
ncbi:AGRG2-like protein, partial [Mya arenaria]